ncbi:beta-lactamase-like protein [Talaromyces proteolyticus]|uniref:Beta-lactamase-like protein n=1 Tax=Talaromyces proteolyticus TaxID=1131652 RepID=A0AAD4KGA5_9EURO|nr:beta-lactamase-like protein [Talaromyces proteolyticus]KAH8690500.1 beta-lactamase-like protein [Talaromyces proteolyticus]
MAILPPLNIPSSPNVCDIWAIDATCEIVCSTTSLMQPEIKGHEKLNLPTFAFYIYNSRLNKRVLFDNGSRKDWWNLPPHVLHGITSKGVLGLDVKYDVYDILQQHQGQEQIVNGDGVDAVVWSHFHYDHTGNIQRFPQSTSIIVGPGFKKEFLPGYPVRQDSPFHQSDFEGGRHLVEISFADDSTLKIGKYAAYDYFGDGSFYLLNTPGHTVGHISGLVRTTPDTFVFLGGDISHFPGMYRPTKYVPMPLTLPIETKLDTPRLPVPCPCTLFTACHPKRKASDNNSGDDEESRTSTFYEPSQESWSWYDDPAEALRSVEALKEFDADENVFVAIAHDSALREVVDVFPNGKMNDWKAKGWAKMSHWHFVNELPVNGQPGRKLIAQGLMKDGDVYRK